METSLMFETYITLLLRMNNYVFTDQLYFFNCDFLHTFCTFICQTLDFNELITTVTY